MPADTNLTAGRTAYCRALYAAIGAAQGGLLYALGQR